MIYKEKFDKVLDDNLRVFVLFTPKQKVNNV